jgi:DNA-binding beta-propeller fold protein YncE
MIAPTGVALSKNNNVLYVADSLNKRLAAIAHPLTRQTSAGARSTLSSGGSLNDPLNVVGQGVYFGDDGTNTLDLVQG